MSVHTRVKNLENKFNLLGLEKRVFIAFSKGGSQLFDKDGSKFVKPKSFNKDKDSLVVFHDSLKQT